MSSSALNAFECYASEIGVIIVTQIDGSPGGSITFGTSWGNEKSPKELSIDKCCLMLWHNIKS
jgi:hypothetical protein